jgi:hypothetical protein
MLHYFLSLKGVRSIFKALEEPIAGKSDQSSANRDKPKPARIGEDCFNGKRADVKSLLQSMEDSALR